MNSPIEQKTPVELKLESPTSLSGPGSLVMNEKLVASIVKREIGQEVTEFEPIVGRGMSNTVFVANTCEGKFVVRLNAVSRLMNFEKEAWCLERAHELGVLVPRVLSVGCEGEKSFSIARYIEASTPIHDGLDKLQLWETLGGYAAKLNSVDIRSYSNDPKLKDWFGGWETFIAREIEIIFRDDYWDKCGLFSPDEVKTLQDKLSEFAETDLPVGVCHWDIGLDNCIAANDKLYMLDLEFALMVPVPHYQLAVVGRTWGFSSPEMEAFTRGYGVSTEQMDEMSQELKCVTALLRARSVRWAQDRAPGEVEGRLADSKSAIRDLLGNEAR